MNTILNGTTYTYELNGWTISWESDGNYRHWCYQNHPQNNRDILIVMLNPGSLNETGANLTKDKTLEVLREVFLDTGFNPFIINLFDLATPDPCELFQKWNNRDNKLLIYDKLKEKDFSGIIFAYGSYQDHHERGHAILERIKLVRDTFNRVPEIALRKNENGTPKHPKRWRIEKLTQEIKSIIKTIRTEAS